MAILFNGTELKLLTAVLVQHELAKSASSAKHLIKEGKVYLNGKLVTSLKETVEPGDILLISTNT